MLSGTETHRCALVHEKFLQLTKTPDDHYEAKIAVEGGSCSAPYEQEVGSSWT